MKYIYLTILYLLITSCGTKTNVSWVVDIIEYENDVKPFDISKKVDSISWSKETRKYREPVFSNGSKLYSLVDGVDDNRSKIFLTTDKNGIDDSTNIHYYYIYQYEEPYPNNRIISVSKKNIYLHNLLKVDEDWKYDICAIDKNNNIKVKWKFDVKTTDEVHSLSPIKEFNNEIYFIDTDNALCCIDKIEGKLIWKKELFSEHDFTVYNILVSENAIFVLSNKGLVKSIDRKDGTENWTHTKKSRRTWPLLLELCGTNIFVSGHNETYAINIFSGKEVKSFKGLGRAGVKMPLAFKRIDDKNMCVYYYMEVAVIDVSSLKIKWRIKTNDIYTDTRYSRYYKGKVLYSKGNMIYAVDALSGNEIWSLPNEYINLDRDYTFIYNDIIFSRIKEKREYYLTMHNIDTGEMINKIGLEELLSGRSILLPKGVSITGYDFKQHKAYYFN